MSLRRVRDIDTMLAEIDEVMRQHQAALGLQDAAAGPSAEGSPAPEGNGEAAPKRRVLRY